MGNIWNKFVIEVRKPKERVNIFNKRRGFPFLNGRKLDGVHFDPPLANNHAKEFYARYIKGPLVKFEGQSMFMKLKQNTLSMFMVECKVTLGVNAQVIHVDFQPALSNHTYL